MDTKNIINAHNQALIRDLVALLRSQRVAELDGFDLFPASARDEASENAHFQVRAQRLLLPTLAAAYHEEREPLLLKLDARIGAGEHTDTRRYMWVVQNGEIVAEFNDCGPALQWAWAAGYRRADEEVSTLDMLVAPIAVGGGEWLTPAEAAAITGTSASGWRNRAAAGKLPGAFKKGKQWLIPSASVKP